MENKPTSQMTEAEFEAWLEQPPEKTEKSEDGEYNHIPIGFLEPDLRHTFNGRIDITIKKQKLKKGTLIMIVRLKVFHPVHKAWQKYDGTGAMVIYGDRPGDYVGSTKTIVLEDIKTAVAACYSECIKNAAKKIGKRFGSDINRVNAPGKKPTKLTEESKKAIVDDRVLRLIEDCKDTAELNTLLPTLPSTVDIQTALAKKLKSLKQKNKTS